MLMFSSSAERRSVLPERAKLKSRLQLFKRWIAHWINNYPLDNSIGFASVYPLDSDLSSGQCYPSFEQLGPDVSHCFPAAMLTPNRPLRKIP